MSNHPYIIGTIVKNRDMFFGRTEILARLHDATRKSSSIAVVGLRRIGKSSLLWHFVHHTELPANSLVVYVDLHDPHTTTVPGLLATILNEFATQLNRANYQNVEPLSQFSEEIEKIRDTGYRPTVCLDEMEKLLQRDCFDRGFFEGLRYLGSHEKLAFITASAARLEDIIRHDNITSPFTNIFMQQNLTGLDKEAVYELLTVPFRNAGRPVPPPSHLERAKQLAGNHPLFLQIAGSLLWQYGGDNLKWFSEQFRQEAREPMRRIWYALSPNEQTAVMRIVTGKGAVTNWIETQQALLQTDLAIKDGAGNVRLFSPMLKHMIETSEFTRLPDNRPVPPTEAGNLRPLTNSSPPAPKQTRPLYAYSLVALVSAIIAAAISLFVGDFWIFFAIFTVILMFVLVGTDKLTGGQFLDWLTTLWKKQP